MKRASDRIESETNERANLMLKNDDSAIFSFYWGGGCVWGCVYRQLVVQEEQKRTKSKKKQADGSKGKLCPTTSSVESATRERNAVN